MTRKPKPPIAIYSALADGTRCQIVEILRTGPIPVHKLANAFAISRPAISRHLRVLKTAGLVAEVKKGRENLYALRTNKLGPAITWIEMMASVRANEANAPDKAAPTPPVETAAANTAPAVTNAVDSDQSPTGQVEKSSDSVDARAPIAIVATKQDRPTRTPKIAAANQMGFDF